MNTDNKTYYADYVLVDGKMEHKLSEEVGGGILLITDDDDKVIIMYNALKAGAAILQLLIDHPWLISFKLKISAKLEDAAQGMYGDKGAQMYRELTSDVSEIELNSTLLPRQYHDNHEWFLTHLLTGTGQFVDRTIYDGVALPKTYPTITFDIDRRKVAHMFETGEFSAAQAFKLYLQPILSVENPTPTDTEDADQLPDYILSDLEGQIERNEQGNQLVDSFREMKKKVQALDARHSGAALLRLFVTEPWLQSFKLTLSVTTHHHDEAYTYRSVSGSCTEIKAVENAVTPESVTTATGEIDQQSADFLIEQSIDEVTTYEDLYRNLTWSWHNSLVLELNRSRIEDLITSKNYSGGKALKQLLKDAILPESLIKV